jgi:MFS family permease
MFMDVSSEAIHALLPLFLVDTLGVAVAAVGLIEGLAEATTAITKVFSGMLSDRLGSRKWLAFIGYGLAALSKPLFPLAHSLDFVVVARLSDRVAKGIRGAPRDALIADITPATLRGAAFGLRQTLDTIGAFGGPLLAVLLMAAYGGHIRPVLWWAVLPAALSALLILVAVREPERNGARAVKQGPIRRADLIRLGRPFWLVAVVGALFTVARFSEAFLILKSQNAGLSPSLVPLSMVGMNVVYSATAAPVGMMSDRIGRRGLLGLGMAVLALADILLAASTGLVGLALGLALWGLHLALTQGLLAALVADTAPEEARGTAFGAFNLLTGTALLPASVLAGVLWQEFGPAATFAAAAGFAAIAALSLRWLPRRPQTAGLSPG